MTFRLRAVRAFALLLGFFLMGVVLLSAMAVLDWLVLTRLVTARASRGTGIPIRRAVRRMRPRI
ncbi:hypothetical protein ACFZB4_29960 [Streptomyces pseudovenezuelae]|uniref:hypothetical protein n=1 Tax=Streptomyces pseudovenezuelae TaxID=67350 RepID=UPI0036E6B1B8